MCKGMTQNDIESLIGESMEDMGLTENIEEVECPKCNTITDNNICPDCGTSKS